MLQEFITMNRDTIIERCRAKVARRSIPPPSETEINHGVPLFLDQLVDALRTGSCSTADIDRSAGEHGHDLWLQGFSISQVVHDYGDVCQTVTELAVETDAPISTDDFRTLNRCLDEAIAAAVTIYTRESQQQATVERTEGNERIAFLVHELRNLLNTAIVAFEVIRSGNVGVSGSTGAVLGRSLLGLRDLINHSLDEVRMARGLTNRQLIGVSELIDDVAAGATLAANARTITLHVPRENGAFTIDGDMQILTAVVGNLLQNAFKFTPRGGSVTLRASATSGRLVIAVEDECGGFPGLPEDQDLEPVFERRASDRAGLGIGLAFCRWGVEAHDGRLYARNLPGKGCIFVVDLPLAETPSTVGA